tara:strand:+ start:55 stop:552 length:498 start_codon:yes stop_codon:yes gene_type:complete
MICEELGWGLNELKILFNELSNYYDNIVFTRDIAGWDQSRGEKNKAGKDISFEETFNLYDLESNKLINNNSNVLIIDNVFGEDLFSVINNSEKVISFHGMMTLIGYVLDKKVLDLWHCRINSWNDYRKYRNAFYEFKPKRSNYDFIIPKKSINKTIDKIKFSLKK